MRTRLLAFATAIAIAACSSSATSTGVVEPIPNVNPPAPPLNDAAPVEDAGNLIADASSDAATADDGILGTLSGSCGNMTALLASTASDLENDALAFVAGEEFTKPSLSPGGQILFDQPNAGGSSFESETMSYEVLRTCAGAELVKTETQISYVPGTGDITDMLVSIAGKKVGVSVTRAYKPSSLSFPDDDVKALLVKKLQGILSSSSRVEPADKWVKQILHVFTANQETTDAVNRVYPTIGAAVRADTIVLVTHTTGGGYLYCNPDPPLGTECP